MKKYFIFILLFLVFGISIIFGVINKGEKGEVIHVGEVTHSPFYAPLYVSIRNGYFKEEGLDIDLTLISGANNVTSAVLSGDIEIGFCGPEATIYIYNGGEKDYLVTFAGLTKRDGQFIVGRSKEDFDWDNLIGKEVLAGRIAGMPELNFENALKNKHIPKEQVKINTSVDYASLSSAFISGEGDYVNLFEPNATILKKMGYGYILESIGKASGEMPYTAFNTKLSFYNDHKDVLIKFTRAIDKGIKYVLNNTSEDIAKIIHDDFIDTDIKDLVEIIRHYKDSDSWLSNPYISEDIFKNLEDIIIDSGEIKEYVPYDKLIRNVYE